MKIVPENTISEMSELLNKIKYPQLTLICFHEWIPDYFNKNLQHCKHCEKVRKSKMMSLKIKIYLEKLILSQHGHEINEISLHDSENKMIAQKENVASHFDINDEELLEILYQEFRQVNYKIERVYSDIYVDQLLVFEVDTIIDLEMEE